MNRKAQMELIGLVVIVILITLGILFMAQFALKEKPTKKIFTRKGLATSTMSAIMKTTVGPEEGCLLSGNYQLQLQEKILEDCALSPPDSAYAPTYQCRGLHSCEFFRTFVEERLNQTLGEWNKRYEFKSYLLEGESPQDLFDPIISKRGKCPKTKDRDTSSPFPLSTRAGLVESILYICD
ncbi:MAG: hypothetical protein KKH52_00490 [Nanoarchaeota archaeon]|nr:hypothetical protein [Nanoarchaeota archaeon]MBU1623130.1 hypothetical protein [Nanoarchaeota archaeon]MBU1973853.1 hypothetical protein [Nanoarchaeota archaeon]